MPKMTLTQVAGAYPGGPSALAARIGASRFALWSWRKGRASVGAHYIAQLAKIALELGVELDLESCAKRREP